MTRLWRSSDAQLHVCLTSRYLICQGAMRQTIAPLVPAKGNNKMSKFDLRSLLPGDSAAAAKIFFDAVHIGTAAYYDEEQREAWGGIAPDPIAWAASLSRLSGFVAEVEGVPIGFITFGTDDFIHHAFVRTDHSGRGVGWRLHNAVENSVLAAGGSRLTTNASKKARPFFERQGWIVELEQTVVRNGVELNNFRMSKVLRGRASAQGN